MRKCLFTLFMIIPLMGWPQISIAPDCLEVNSAIIGRILEKILSTAEIEQILADKQYKMSLTIEVDSFGIAQRIVKVRCANYRCKKVIRNIERYIRKNKTIFKICYSYEEGANENYLELIKQDFSQQKKHYIVVGFPGRLRFYNKELHPIGNKE